MTRSRGKKLALLAACGAVTVLVVCGLYHHRLRFLFRLATQFDRLPDNEQGYPEYRHRQTGIVFVRVPAGRFLMGSTPGEETAPYELPQHEVRLGSFLIAKYETSQKVWETVMGTNPSRYEGAELPVEDISWHDCREFCVGTGLRLPTEAQWEYACRAGTNTKFNVGPVLRPTHAHYREGPPHGGDVIARILALESQPRTAPVDSYAPNAFGIHNMHGNVAEWCEDVFDPEFYGRSASSGRDPVCTSPGRYRVVRGGHVGSRASQASSFFRARFPPDWAGSFAGRPSGRAGTGFLPGRNIRIGFRAAFYVPR